MGAFAPVRAQTYNLQAIATFNGDNGANPEFGLAMDASGNLYGTTVLGGASNNGTVFKVSFETSDHPPTPNPGPVSFGTGDGSSTNVTLTTLATFDGDERLQCAVRRNARPQRQSLW